MRNPLREICTVGSVRGETFGATVNLNGHETGNGGNSQGEPTASRDLLYSEIHGSYRLAVIAQKSQPALGRLWDSRCSPHPAGNGCFRHLEAEHEEFAVDARRTASGILRDHPEDQFTDLFGNSPTATNPLSYLAEHGLIGFESGPVPPSNRFRTRPERASPSIETRSGAPATKTAYRAAPAWVWDARWQVVGAGRGSPT